ncbi:MAG TPA: LpqB family beta-propeller domain-containing protein [Propionibacteriaceae bacterium]|nr:LpqB family beta-propeller domain-containing protein [Propionibacteriaceae bacterium]
MRWANRQVAAVVIVLASLFGAAACVNVPTSGPIDKVEGQQARNQNYVNVEVVPPAPGAKGKQIVEGFLRANNSYQPNYVVAKQFLTRSAAEQWTPEAGASIYTGWPKDKGDTVTLDGWLVGSLSPDRTYTAEDKELTHDFGMVEEDGEWRINKPPQRLMVANFYFSSFYRPYDRYFVGNRSTLVPDPIYLPALTNPANVASALIKGLLTGPSNWLKPAVSNAIPPNTSLSVDSVTITDGIAEVPLSDSVLDLPDQQRSLMAAQIAYTLRQVGGIKGVVIKVNQQPYRVPGSDPNSLAISVDAIPRDLEPVPFVAGDQLYAVQDKKAVQPVTTNTNPPGVKALDGPLGEGRYQIDALAVSLTNTDLAATTDGGTTLLRSSIGEGDLIHLLRREQGVSELLRPQFTRYNEIWTIGRQGGRQKIWIFTAAPPATPGGDSKITPKVIDLPPELRNVKAFKISPDGTRMALVRDLDFEGKSELVLGRIIRSDEIVVNEWQVVDTTQTNNNTPQIQTIADVAWRDATELLVLGAAPADTAFAPYLVVQDGSTITPHGEPGNKDGDELAVLPGRQTAIILGRDGRLWRDDGSQLPIEGGKVSAIAYPG